MITRSDLIHRAAKQLPSRFLLVQTVARASRLTHRRGTRMGLTINDILEQIADAPESVLAGQSAQVSEWPTDERDDIL